MIRISDVTKKYGDFVAVSDVSLSIAGGEVFGFIGPNGAGKTTMIRMLGGILAPTSGRIHICGIDMAEAPEDAKARVGFIPDRPYLYEKLTAMEFLRFTADLYHVDADAFPEKAIAMLTMFSLDQWADHLIESFSHGMKQRLIMAGALLHDPDVLIVDEPMVGLDPAGIRMVKDLLREKATNGSAVFMSTHTLSVAQEVCDRVGVINRGKLIAIGTMADLQLQSGAKQADLEEVFFRLTQEESM
ncbi:MAG: ABC transporter ATP-binding protein [Thermodesulfobacteriota bacterium]|nr:ABC transporter ATP-binding protein [Thermodesulfobacteriota bacterium]